MTQVTVATLNLHQTADRWRERRHLITAELLDLQPDLIALQEVAMPVQQAKWLCKQINMRMTGSDQRPYHIKQARRRHWRRGYREGVAVLSRCPILYHDVFGMGYDGCVAIRVHVQLPSHQTMDFVSTRLHDIARDREAREEQAMRLYAWMQRYKQVPLQVLAGDFGEVPHGRAIEILSQSFRSAYAAKHGCDPVATYPTVLAKQVAQAACLDYIFVSKSVKQVSAAAIFCDQPDHTDPTLYPSDHVGLIATLEV